MAFLSFVAAATVVIIAPGPDSLLVMRNTVRGGTRAGLFTAAGTLTGLTAWALAAVTGLAALLRASEVGYDVLRYVGAAYLVWLGVTSLGLWHRHEREASTTVDRPAGHPPRHPFINGVVSNVCNPKIGVFFLAFLPNFMPAEQSDALTSSAFGLWFVLETGVWLALVVWMISNGVRWLRRVSVQRWLERATGVVLIGFGIKLAAQG